MKLSVLTLLAAISEGKKKLLKDRYGVTDEQLAVVDDTDPTPSGQYAEWITRSWVRQNLIHLPEDRDVVRGNLNKFNRVKNRPEWAGGRHSKDILSFTPETLREALLSIEDKEEVEGGPKLPTLSDQAVVMYQDETYILWKINSVNDAMIISAPSGWCTKGDHMAERYTSEGSLYPAYKNGEPFFQYHPGGKQTGSPQFMNRFNSTMQSVKLMNEEAYNLIKKGAERSGDTNLAKVVDEFSVPNLSEAETLSYLVDVLKTNPEYAKGNKEFQDLENKFVGQRYKIFDLDELSALMTRYPRTGEVVSKMLDENAAVRGLIKKLDAYDSYPAFLKDAKRGSEHSTAIPQDEQLIIASIPALFSKVFKLFSKSIDLDTKVNALKVQIKEKNSKEAYKMANEISSLIEKGFINNSYTYSDTAWANQKAYPAAMKYADIISNMVRPLISAVYNDIEAQTTLSINDLRVALTTQTNDIQRQFQNDRKLREWADKRQEAILIPKVMEELNRINSHLSEFDLATIGGWVVKIHTDAWGEYNGAPAEVQAKEQKIIDNKITELFGAIEAEGLEAIAAEVDKIKREAGRVSSRIGNNREMTNFISTLTQDLLSELVREELAKIPKLKAVTEKLDDLPIPDYNWLLKLGEARKAEIRAANEERLQAKTDRVERGEAKARYSPKKEIDTWMLNEKARRPYRDNLEHLATLPPLTPISEKGEAFLLGSPSYEIYEKARYFIAMKKESKELEKMLFESGNALALLFDYLDAVKNNERWPELEAKVLNFGYQSDWVAKYKKAVFKDEDWPGFEENFLNNLRTSQNYISTLVDYNTEMREGKVWPELEKRVKDYLKTPEGQEQVMHSYYFDRRVANPILMYVATTKKRLDTDLEAELCKNEEFAMGYLWKLLPPSKVTEILSKFQDDETNKGKTSSYHMNLFSVLMNELEKL